MAQPAVEPRSFQRGACLGSDGVYYPAEYAPEEYEEENRVPLSDLAVGLIAYLYFALRRMFQDSPNVKVGADQFIYWIPGNPRLRIAPDVYVIHGVPREPPRSVIRTWEENTPSLVVEISSKLSRAEDRGHKFQIYQDVLCCLEYLIYDADTGELLLYRLEEGRYALQEPDAQGRFYSQAVDAWFGPDPETLVRLYQSDLTPVIHYDEFDAEQKLLRDRLEEAWRRAEDEGRRAEEAWRQAEDERQRAEAMALENERLRAEIERLRGG